MSDEDSYGHNFFFLGKMGLLVLAAVNMTVLHALISRDIERWGSTPHLTPMPAKIAGVCSLCVWVADTLHDELEITAPKVLTKPWKTRRIFFRQRAKKYDIVEGVCLDGYFKPGVDKDGFEIYIPTPHDVGGNRIPPK